MPTHHHFQFQGSDCSYFSYHDEKKPLIVMVHGFRGTHHGLEKIITELSDYHVIALDLPGFGVSEPLKEHSVSSYVSFLHAFLSSVSPTGCTLLGHSFGSILTAHYAALYPTTIQRLILVNPIGSPALKGPMKVMTYLAIFYYWVGRILPAKWSHRWLATPFIIWIMTKAMTKTKDKTMQQYILAQHLAHFSEFASPRVVAEAFRASVSSTAREVASHLSMPTLIIAGTQDDITPLEKQQLFAKEAQAQLVVIEHVGHLIHYETAPKAAQAINTFIQADLRKEQ